MTKIYCISGLGADQRLFDKLTIEGYELVPVFWTGYTRQDDMVSYAQKLTAQIPDPHPVIIGLSLGGMLAVEIAKQNPAAKVFIVSSAKTASELVIHGGGLARWLINSMIIPAQLLTIPNFVVLNKIGAYNREDRKLLSRITRDSDCHFVKWALTAIANWKNDHCPQNVTHIHGTADRTIPSAKVHPHHWIKDGSHIMIYNRAPEISRIISDCLAR